MKVPRPPTDYRKIRNEFNRRGLWLIIASLIFIGIPLIAIAYGPTAAVTAALCMLGGVGLILLIWLILGVIGKWAGSD